MNAPLPTNWITAEVCECLPLPEIHWHHRGGDWETIGDISGDGEVDGTRFNAGDYDAWMIRCPDCDLVYGSGGNYRGVTQ